LQFYSLPRERERERERGREGERERKKKKEREREIERVERGMQLGWRKVVVAAARVARCKKDAPMLLLFCVLLTGNVSNAKHSFFNKSVPTRKLETCSAGAFVYLLTS
jgi:hypothetical protein